MSEINYGSVSIRVGQWEELPPGVHRMQALDAHQFAEGVGAAA
jgi:hypothetical protein